MTVTAAPLSAAAQERTRHAHAALGDLYPFEPHFHDARGVNQHYLDEGPRDAPAVLCLHGNPTWSFAWRDLIGPLSAEHRLIVPDHVGCGLSDKPADYPYVLEQHIQNVEDLVASLGLERITLVLHDWGGAIGMGFARRHPGKVARIALMNTAAFLSTDIPLRISICRLPGFGALAVRGFNGFVRAATRAAVERPMSAQVRRGYLLPYDSYANRVAIHRFVQDIPLAPGHPSYPELEAIDASLERFTNTPVALFWGERDWCFTPAFREVWQRRLPQARVQIFEDAGHYVFEDEPARLRAGLLEFLSAHPLP